MIYAEGDVFDHDEHVSDSQPLKNCVDWSLGHVFACQHDDVKDIGNRTEDAHLIWEWYIYNKINIILI